MKDSHTADSTDSDRKPLILLRSAKDQTAGTNRLLVPVQPGLLPDYFYFPVASVHKFPFPDYTHTPVPKHGLMVLQTQQYLRHSEGLPDSHLPANLKKNGMSRQLLLLLSEPSSHSFLHSAGLLPAATSHSLICFRSHTDLLHTGIMYLPKHS